jgi:hypothetical protein
MVGETYFDLESEAMRIIESAQTACIPLRLVGGLAVRMRCKGNEFHVLREGFSDLDFVTYNRHSEALTRHMPALNYQANKRFNAVYGARRLLFENPDNGISFDVILDRFVMCHTLSFVGRLELDQVTVPLCDLLLTKLQIVNLTEKDLLDIYSLLLSFDLVEGPSNTGIDLSHIARICAGDWGWYRTVTKNLERVAQLSTQDLEKTAHEVVQGRIRQLQDTIEAAPKTPRWQLRAVIGERLPWYEQPEEVSRDRPV